MRKRIKETSQTQTTKKANFQGFEEIVKRKKSLNNLVIFFHTSTWTHSVSIKFPESMVWQKHKQGAFLPSSFLGREQKLQQIFFCWFHRILFLSIYVYIFSPSQPLHCETAWIKPTWASRWNLKSQNKLSAKSI